MPPVLLDEPKRITYPARFEQMPIDTEFETDACPSLRFRKSTNGRGECVTAGRRSRSQFFHATAPVKPIGWTVSERNLDDDFANADEAADDDGDVSGDELAQPAGVKSAKTKQAGIPGTGGQRTPKPAAVAGPAGGGGQTTVDSSDI